MYIHTLNWIQTHISTVQVEEGILMKQWEDGEKLHNEELHKLYSLPNIIRMILQGG
jgi:hypothetical protein